MTVGKGMIVPVGGDYRHLQLLRQGYRFIGGLGVDDTATGQQQGPLRLGQDLRRLFYGIGVAGDPVINCPVGLWRLDLPINGLTINQVPRNIQQNRPSLSGERSTKGVV